MKNKQNLLRNLFFIFIVIIQIALCIYYVNTKHNLYIDEIWTFNLSNNYFNPFVDSNREYMNQWIDSKALLQSLTVRPGEEFSYDSVFYNQARDVHPPLYYIIIHTICSFYPEQFSIWFGIIPNLIFFISTQVILLRISDKLFSNKWLTILPCILYGFSWGAINTVIYIRMYMMLTFFCVLSFYIHLLLFEHYNTYKNLNKNYLLSIFIVTVLGFLTQYYYVIFAFFLSGFYYLWLYKNTEIKIAIKYATIVIGGIITGILIFPAFLQQLFRGYRGTEAARNLLKSNLEVRLEKFIEIINMDIFGNSLGLILVLFSLCCLIKLIQTFCEISINNSNRNFCINIKISNLNKFQENYTFEISKNNLVFCGIILFTTCIFLLIVKIAPFLDNRYIYMLYPFLSLILIKSYVLWFGHITRNKIISFIMLFIIISSNFNMYNSNNIKFSFAWKNTKEIEQIINTNYPNINSIVISGNNNWYPSVSQLLLFSKTKQTLIINQNDCDKLNKFLQPFINKNNAVIIYITNNVKNEKAIIKNITLQSPYKSFKKLDSNHGNTYLFTK